MEEQKGLNERLEEITKLLKEEKENKKEKKFKLPFGKKVGNGQRKKNYVTLVTLYENRSCDIKKVRIEDQTIMVDGVPRLASADYVFQYKKNPMIFLPSWSVEPFSPTENFKKSLEEGTNTKGYKILLAKMLSATTDAKKQMGGMLKWILIVGAVGIIAYAVITNIG